MSSPALKGAGQFERAAAAIRMLVRKASPLPWEAENEKSDGAVWVTMRDPQNKRLFGTENSDVILIEEEYVDEFHAEWDATGRANFALIEWLTSNSLQLMEAAAAMEARYHAALRSQAAWIAHWRVDAEHRLVPTHGSLNEAAAEIESALTNT